MGRETDPSGSLPEVEVLRGICHAFGSVHDFREGMRSSVRWVRLAVGKAETSVRISLPDRAGHLRTAIAEGDRWTAGRRRSARRRLAYQTKKSIYLRLADRQILALIPLVARGESVGTLEVIAPEGILKDRASTLDAVASQIAILTLRLREQEALREAVRALERPVRLADDLLRTGTPEGAIRTAVRFVHQRLSIPAAGWYGGGGEPQLTLESVAGLGARRGRELRRQMRSIPSWKGSRLADREKLMAEFCSVAGVEAVSPIGAGNWLLLVGGESTWMGQALGFLREVLADVVGHLGAVADAEQRNQQRLNLGIAVTAHEIRRPLLGVKAAIESVLLTLAGPGSGSESGQQLLRWSERELKELAHLVDRLLSWSVGSGSMRRRPVRLERIIREAADSCQSLSQRPVVVSVPANVIILADRRFLKAALANVIGNALTYGGGTAPVSVTVRATSDVAEVTVRDRGPGVSAGERESIFEPLVRGSAARLTPDGAGLGLFIARRVIEAHEGAIRVESRGKGATFRIRLPVGGQEISGPTSRTRRGNPHGRSEVRPRASQARAKGLSAL